MAGKSLIGKREDSVNLKTFLCLRLVMLDGYMLIASALKPIARKYDFTLNIARW